MGKKILVVDDEPDILRVVVVRLKKLGYDVKTATNGREALETAAVERPDLVLLDIRMPIMDGYQVCREMRTNDALKTVPVVFLTASGNAATEQRPDPGDHTDCLLKPFDPEVLIAKVKQYIG